MTVEEKLQHFYDVSVKEAKKEADRQVEEHRRALEKQLEEHKKEKQHQSLLEISTEIDNARREVNKALSAEQFLIKQNWSKQQLALKEKLFSEVKERLEAFRSSPDYEDYLKEKIIAAGEFAQGDEIRIYVTPEDTARIQKLAEDTGLPIEAAGESFLGGIRAIIPEKNILINHSFLDSFNTLRKEFTFDGGLHHE